MEDLEVLDTNGIHYTFKCEDEGEEEFVVDSMSEDANFLGQMVYADGDTFFVQDGSGFVLSEEQTIILQEDTSNVEEIYMTSDVKPELFFNETSNPKNSDSDIIQYTVLDDPLNLPSGSSSVVVEDGTEVMDISHVLGKNLLTGQTVSLEGYLERITNPKRKRKAKVDKSSDVLNKKISLGVTASGKKLYGRILHIEKKGNPKNVVSLQTNTHDSSTTDTKMLVDVHADKSQETKDKDAELSDNQLQYIVNVLGNLNDYVQKHPLIVRVYEQQDEDTVYLGIMRGCIDKGDDGALTYVNFNQDGNEVKQLKFKLRYANPIVLSITLVEETTGLRAQTIVRDPTYNQNICLFCYKETKSLKVLQKHYCTHHPGFLTESEEPFVRPVVRCHMSDRFRCTRTECGRYFTNSSSLRRHQAVHDPDLRTFECTVCSQRFTEANSLVKHLLTHTGIKPHLCTICGRGFTNVGDMNTHRETHYFGTKMYTCSTCGRSFLRRSNLDRHRKVHNDGEYCCHICDCSFRHLSSLTRHVMQTHGAAGLRNLKRQ